MKNLFRRIYIKLFRPSRVVVSQTVSFEDANALINLKTGWEMAKTPDELLDRNLTIIEKREYITE